MPCLVQAIGSIILRMILFTEKLRTLFLLYKVFERILDSLQKCAQWDGICVLSETQHFCGSTRNANLPRVIGYHRTAERENRHEKRKGF